ncbi:hypothetical protein [Photorhabdus sp. SF281]|uniref:hypothetical protein n=1 Tax=Photorhabdus sp. SF281 TaxID=3459527 RepID=UPI004044DBD6
MLKRTTATYLQVNLLYQRVFKANIVNNLIIKDTEHLRSISSRQLKINEQFSRFVDEREYMPDDAPSNANLGMPGNIEILLWKDYASVS